LKRFLKKFRNLLENMETIIITKIEQNTRKTTEDVVTSEVPFTLSVNGEELVTLLCSPFDLEDLARGFLFTSGLIKNLDEIKKILIDKQRWAAYVDTEKGSRIDRDLIFKRIYTSGGGRGTLLCNTLDIIPNKITSNFTIKSSEALVLMADFQKKSESYFRTGGVHSAALADKENILVFREDIGRHNAIDKVVGQMLLENSSFEGMILMTSGRIPSEVLLKVQKCSVPVVISRSAPTNQAVRYAREMNVTLIGFARDNRMNIYSAEERII